MYCKRCDGAYHCYCQQPPHKNVSRGPYLCPKHTRCHSCGSTVPGSGLSTRWFLGYTCCDACGRLFVKGNYCPVCLKVMLYYTQFLPAKRKLCIVNYIQIYVKIVHIRKS
ncbi:hypothetical protein B296_00040739 [Ensete ventricosum]|uniref:Uncharacterized protein n=1 Tax=Ensete ventricosum TaxID=4639 RepID=A0A426ZPB6_ENSVE|nr:hypothetical protein B296_00040739 [Ensete ventricosum]